MTRRFLRSPSIVSTAWPCSLVEPSIIPVYINNRDRLTTTSSLVKWLLESGTKRIVIIDNASTYPALLDYYKNRPTGVDVHFLKRNGGPRAFWDQGMYNWQDTPYIVTDSDVIPDEGCPRDLVHQLNVLLNANPWCDKVGPGLRIDDISDVKESEQLNGWSIEEQRPYWSKRHSPMAFYAPVDTTFALYGDKNPKHSQKVKNLRMDLPYVIRHLPWYVTLKTMTEEEKYYRTHTEIGPQGPTHPWSHNHGLLEPREEHPWKDNPKEQI